MDCLRALRVNNSSFEFVKLLFSSEVLEDLKEMKRLVEETGKVSEELLVEFDNYLAWLFCFTHFRVDFYEFDCFQMMIEKSEEIN